MVSDFSKKSMPWYTLRSTVQVYTKTKKMSKKQGLKWSRNAVILIDFLNIYGKYEIFGTQRIKYLFL